MIAFLHTADIHIATFDRALNAIAPQMPRRHVVRAELLDRARKEGLGAVDDQTREALAELAPDAHRVVCTCSTLGPLLDPLPAKFLRADRPLMEALCHSGNNPLVVICLESTRMATQALLHHCARQADIVLCDDLLLCEEAWPHFENANTEAFAQSIANAVQTHLANAPQPSAIALAQVSMTVAAPYLTHLGIPILTIPQLAAKAALGRHIA